MDARSVLQGSHSRGELHLATVSGVASTKKELIRLFDRNISSVDVITTKSFQVVPTPGLPRTILMISSPS